jgi:hypothetical protein
MEWSEIHLNSLNSAVIEFESRHDKIYRITTYDDLERGLFCIKAENIGALNVIRVGLIAGDFIHNLRASLDHIAWELAQIGNKNPSSEICFPVFSRDTAKTQTAFEAATKGIPPEAIEIMESLQPYHGGSSYKSHNLWRLNKLWNLDKHRNTAISLTSDVIAHVPPGIPVQDTPVEDGHIMTIPISAKDNVRLNPSIGGTILFGDETQGIALKIQDLRDIYEFVSLEVWPALRGFIS